MKIQKIPIDKILPYHLNNKNHPDSQIQEIAASIKEFGFMKPIILDENMVILAGHGAFLGAVHIGMTKIPSIIHTNLSERQKKAYRIADNKLAEKSIWDFDKLAAELSALTESEYDIDIIGFNEEEIDAILKDSPGLFENSVAANPIVVKSHERKKQNFKSSIKNVCVVGDKFSLGGIELMITDEHDAIMADWLIRRWQIKTGENAVHSEGLSFEKLSDARNK